MRRGARPNSKRGNRGDGLLFWEEHVRVALGGHVGRVKTALGAYSFSRAWKRREVILLAGNLHGDGEADREEMPSFSKKYRLRSDSDA
jgi:hypothetical protein